MRIVLISTAIRNWDAESKLISDLASEVRRLGNDVDITLHTIENYGIR